ncbi:unnamed protein product [Lymnaea stagnalis]|uniref:HIT-type domain-containing protein n=1 Tax=Lymnaea stagnalis TaxID=6523 RepID=A0AAV2IJ21_LYMST
MSTCTVCNIPTNKYKCPKCLERYCSLACCKAHRETCSQIPKKDSTANVITGPEVPVHVPYVQEVHHSFSDILMNANEDRVPDELLQKLGDSTKLKSALNNPHLRAMMENLVNTDAPELTMAKAMKEPIFTEFADLCLKIVDRDNPNLEPENKNIEFYVFSCLKFLKSVAI